MPAAATNPPADLPALSPADQDIFNALVACRGDATALAESTRRSLSDLVLWYASPAVQTWLRAYDCLCTHAGKLQDYRAIASAINTLTKVAETHADPVERRRAAVGIIRACTAARAALLAERKPLPRPAPEPRAPEPLFGTGPAPKPAENPGNPRATTNPITLNAAPAPASQVRPAPQPNRGPAAPAKPLNLQPLALDPLTPAPVAHDPARPKSRPAHLLASAGAAGPAP